MEFLSNDDNFINTAVHLTEENPEPIIFEISSDGFEKSKSEKDQTNIASIASSTLLSQSPIKKPWAC